jgi:hypothetical protein
MKKPKYPIYVISKGRADCCYTAKFLTADGCQFTLAVEPQEYDEYRKHFPDASIIVTPFKNLGLGSIPVRNFVWEHSKGNGHARHWILDDNIRNIYRKYKTNRVRCNAIPAFIACEEFTDRYTNIGISGMNYSMFAVPKKQPPFYLNNHVYSCLCIDNSLDLRWRGRYNEDTDLCLQVLASGLCTVLFNAFLINKMRTMTMKGGNSSQLYQGDGRLTMARNLERMWPGVVTTDRRYGRPQHVVKDSWRKFDTQLIRRSDINFDELSGNNEFGMSLNQVTSQIKTEEVRRLLNGESN